MIPRPLRILITGPQGSGKTTQAKIIAEKLGLCFISSGDLARQKAEEPSVEGEEFKQALAKGDYVDDKIIGRLFEQAITNCTQGFISDAYPRSVAQLSVFDPNFDWVFYLNLPESESIARLQKRGRADDTWELIKNRLRNHHLLTAPVAEHYQKLGKLTIINGNQPIDQVTQDILQEMED